MCFVSLLSMLSLPPAPHLELPVEWVRVREVILVLGRDEGQLHPLGRRRYQRLLLWRCSRWRRSLHWRLWLRLLGRRIKFPGSLLVLFLGGRGEPWLPKVGAQVGRGLHPALLPLLGAALLEELLSLRAKLGDEILDCPGIVLLILAFPLKGHLGRDSDFAALK